MDLDKYFDLPDYMAPKELASLFVELLDSTNQVAFNQFKTAEALDQLADRQWHTYSVLDEDIKVKVVKWIQTNWIKSSFEFTELVTAIVAKLGLAECVPLLKSALQEKLPLDVRNEIVESLKEYEYNVADPYSGLRSKHDK